MNGCKVFFAIYTIIALYGCIGGGIFTDGDIIEIPKPGEIHCIVKFPVYGPLPQVFRVYVNEKNGMQKG